MPHSHSFQGREGGEQGKPWKRARDLDRRPAARPCLPLDPLLLAQSLPWGFSPPHPHLSLTAPRRLALRTLCNDGGRPALSPAPDQPLSSVVVPRRGCPGRGHPWCGHKEAQTSLAGSRQPARAAMGLCTACAHSAPRSEGRPVHGPPAALNQPSLGPARALDSLVPPSPQQALSRRA